MKKNHLVLVFAFVFLVFPLCAFAEECGDGSCAEGGVENSCTCPLDCGECSGPVPREVCKEYACSTNNICRPVTVENCCGNRICEGEETYAECPADCIPTSVDIEVLSPLEGETFFRGEDALIQLKITADGRNAISADVSVEGFFGNMKLYNDGRHDDNSGGDAVFANSVYLDENTEEGVFRISAFATFLGVDSNETIFDFVVDPGLDVEFETAGRHTIGGIIDICGTVMRKETPVAMPLLLKINSGDTVLFETEIESDSSGRFSHPYHTSMLEPVGNWTVFLSGRDEFSNYADSNKQLVVERAKTAEFLAIEFVNEFSDSYERESQMQLIVNVKNADGNAVTGADTSLLTPLNETIPLHELREGQYSGVYDIPYNTPTGKKKFEVRASKSDKGIVYDGFTSKYITISKTTINIEVLEPKEIHYKIGDVMPIKLKVTYPSGRLVGAATGKALIGGKELPVPQTSTGILQAVWLLEEQDAGIVKLFIEVSDEFGNSGLNETRLEISGTSFLYNLQKNSPLILLAAGVIFLVLLVAGFMAGAFLLMRKMGARKEELQNLREGLQKEYFEKGSMGREEYHELLSRYEHEMDGIDRRMEKKGGKK